MNLRKKLSDEDLERIRNAVKEAEKTIAGEIVPVIVEMSGRYPQAVYKAAIAFGMVFFLTVIIIDRYLLSAGSLTLFYDPIFIFFFVLTGGTLGALLARFSDFVKRWFISRDEMDEQTQQRAETTFLEEEIFNTRHRTGIMIFVSMFEHEVVVMGDSGINKVVDQKEWDQLVADLISHIKRGELVAGMEAEVKRCAKILLEKGFMRTADDVNELGDDLRIN